MAAFVFGKWELVARENGRSSDRPENRENQSNPTVNVAVSRFRLACDFCPQVQDADPSVLPNIEQAIEVTRGVSSNCVSGPKILNWNALSEKKNERDSAQPDFWSQRYVSGATPWQLDRVPARLTDFIRSLQPDCKVLIPGCGQDGRTIDAFHAAGHRVTAIDFSPIAVAATKKALSQAAERIILGDFFSYDFKNSPFDLVYERTFLCSLPPRLWGNYVTRVVELLRPHGTLAGFFFYGKESDPPPYPLTKSKATEIFAGRFDLQKSEPVTDSLSIFAGQEKWQEWQLRKR